MKLHRFLSLLLTACLALGLTGCGSSASFTWRVERVPSNLDPQLAQESPELIAVTNLFRGLTRMDETGQPVLDCADSYTVSADGLTYAFTLKDDLAYTKLSRHEKEYPLTAHDFVFGMQRVFRPETGSPYTTLFGNLKNAQAILDGSMDASQLGVSAPDAKTVVFQLEEPDDSFLAKLSQPGAMPCNQEFFEHSAGAYGLSAANTLANGHFYLYNWNENGLFLRRSGSGSLITSLRLVIDSGSDTDASGSSSSSSAASSSAPLSGVQRVQQEDATAAIDSASAAGSLPSIPYTATTWGLVFNCEDKQLSAAGVRLALSASAASAVTDLPQDFSVAEGLLPPALTVDGQNYRQAAGSLLPAVADVRDTCRTGLATAGLTQFSGIQVLYPEGSVSQQLVEQINQQWQRDLGSFSAYFSLKALPLDELRQAVASGEYQIALLPFSPASNDAADFLAQFTGGSLTGWQDSTFDSDVNALLRSLQPTVSQVAQAESRLLAAAPVYPLWYQDQALILASGVEHVVFQPFGPVLDLTWATYTE